MKKLMIVGAIAAATVGYGAEASYLAQVYDATLTVKTGVCKEGKATAATVKYYESILGRDNSPFASGDEAGFRKQATRKILGVFWGCHCDTIAAPQWGFVQNTANLEGYVFWDQASETHFVIPNTKFVWALLNRINNDFKTVEGTWILANNVDPQALYLMGAGFGKASVAANCDRSIISNISGNFAGFRFPGTDDLVGDCPYCNLDGCSIVPFCAPCAPGVVNTQLTAAYGTWKIKFNTSAAKKLSKKMKITESYTFKKAGNLKDVLARMERWAVAYRNNRTANADYGDDEDVALDPDELKSAYNFAVVSGAKLTEDGTVVIGADADEVEEDAYLSELGYQLYSETYEGDEDALIDIGALIDQVVESDDSGDDES